MIVAMADGGVMAGRSKHGTDCRNLDAGGAIMTFLPAP